jgi:putative transposase
MSTQRKSYSAEFKAKAAVEAIQAHRTMNEIAGELGIHPLMLGQWKKQAVEGLPQVFANPRSKADREAESLTERLYQEIGQLKVELDWLKKKCGRSR